VESPKFFINGVDADNAILFLEEHKKKPKKENEFKHYIYYLRNNLAGGFEWDQYWLSIQTEQLYTTLKENELEQLLSLSDISCNDKHWSAFSYLLLAIARSKGTLLFSKYLVHHLDKPCFVSLDHVAFKAIVKFLSDQRITLEAKNISDQLSKERVEKRSQNTQLILTPNVALDKPAVAKGAIVGKSESSANVASDKPVVAKGAIIGKSDKSANVAGSANVASDKSVKNQNHLEQDSESSNISSIKTSVTGEDSSISIKAPIKGEDSVELVAMDTTMLLKTDSTENKHYIYTEELQKILVEDWSKRKKARSWSDIISGIDRAFWRDARWINYKSKNKKYLKATLEMEWREYGSIISLEQDIILLFEQSNTMLDSIKLFGYEKYFLDSENLNWSALWQELFFLYPVKPNNENIDTLLSLYSCQKEDIKSYIQLVEGWDLSQYKSKIIDFCASESTVPLQQGKASVSESGVAHQEKTGNTETAGTTTEGTTTENAGITETDSVIGEITENKGEDTAHTLGEALYSILEDNERVDSIKQMPAKEMDLRTQILAPSLDTKARYSLLEKVLKTQVKDIVLVYAILNLYEAHKYTYSIEEWQHILNYFSTEDWLNIMRNLRVKWDRSSVERILNMHNHIYQGEIIFLSQDIINILRSQEESILDIVDKYGYNKAHLYTPFNIQQFWQAVGGSINRQQTDNACLKKSCLESKLLNISKYGQCDYSYVVSLFDTFLAFHQKDVLFNEFRFEKCDEFIKDIRATRWGTLIQSVRSSVEKIKDRYNLTTGEMDLTNVSMDTTNVPMRDQSTSTSTPFIAEDINIATEFMWQLAHILYLYSSDDSISDLYIKELVSSLDTEEWRVIIHLLLNSLKKSSHYSEFLFYQTVEQVKAFYPHAVATSFCRFISKENSYVYIQDYNLSVIQYVFKNLNLKKLVLTKRGYKKTNNNSCVYGLTSIPQNNSIIFVFADLFFGSHFYSLATEKRNNIDEYIAQFWMDLIQFINIIEPLKTRDSAYYYIDGYLKPIVNSPSYDQESGQMDNYSFSYYLAALLLQKLQNTITNNLEEIALNLYLSWLDNPPESDLKKSIIQEEITSSLEFFWSDNPPESGLEKLIIQLMKQIMEGSKPLFVEQVPNWEMELELMKVHFLKDPI